MAEKIKIGGELEPKTIEGILGDASTIIDRTNYDIPKRQDDINAEKVNISDIKDAASATAVDWEDEDKPVSARTARVIKEYVENKLPDDVLLDDVPTVNSNNAVKSRGIKTAIDNVSFSTNEKVKDIGIDAEPTVGSDNLVKSGGVFNAFSFTGLKTKALIANINTALNLTECNELYIGKLVTQSLGYIDVPISIQKNDKLFVKYINGTIGNDFSVGIGNSGVEQYIVPGSGYVSQQEYEAIVVASQASTLLRIYKGIGIYIAIYKINNSLSLNEIINNLSQLSEQQQEVEELISGGGTEEQEVSFTPILNRILKSTTVDIVNNWAITDYIDIGQMSKLRLVATQFPGTPYVSIQLYKEDKSFATAQNYTDISTDTTIQNNGYKYMRVSYRYSNSGELHIYNIVTIPGLEQRVYAIENKDTKKINKNINFVGMSIWWYDGRELSSSGFMGGVTARGYQTLLKEQFHFLSDTGTQYCYSGYSLGGLTNDDNYCIMNQSNSWTESENAIWTLDTITNDFKRNIPIGTINDYLNKTGVLTYYGALREFKDKVELLSGNDAIIICSNALHRNNSGYTSTSQNTNGDTLTDFEYALMNVAARNNWYFVDQFRLSGITDDSISLTTLDGLHLNNFGYTIAVKPWIEQFGIIYKTNL